MADRDVGSTTGIGGGSVRRTAIVRSAVLVAALVTTISGCMWGANAPSSFSPAGIDDGGTLVGTNRTDDGRSRAAKVTPDGTVVTLALPPGLPAESSLSYAKAISERGVVVGVASSGAAGPVVWTTDGAATFVPLPPTVLSAAAGLATDVNPSGVVVGAFISLPNTFHPFVSHPPYATSQELPVPPGFTGGQALAINRHGTVAGVGLRIDGTARALRWQLGSPTSVEQLSPELPAAQFTRAVDVNDAGVIVGATTHTNVVMWSAGSTTAVSLPALPGTPRSAGDPYINDRGTIVVGLTFADDTVRPYKLAAGSGAWTELAPSAPEPTITIVGLNNHDTGVGRAGDSTSARPVTFT
jgi:uncharacterized membrane protein